jgi:hypothetical protein
MQIPLNEPECECLGLVRMALSEETEDDRLRAIEVIRREVVSLGLQNFPVGGSSHPDFVQWVAHTAQGRYDAAHEFGAIARRYESKNERKLNVAEYIGKCVWDSIQAENFQGVQVKGGLLEQTRDYAKQNGVGGARDLDVLRKIWSTYRGVVHLGMAMDYCEDYPETKWHVLHLAETFRAGLASNCPKGTSSPYVDPEGQISFLYISDR